MVIWFDINIPIYPKAWIRADIPNIMPSPSLCLNLLTKKLATSPPMPANDMMAATVEEGIFSSSFMDTTAVVFTTAILQFNTRIKIVITHNGLFPRKESHPSKRSLENVFLFANVDDSLLDDSWVNIPKQIKYATDVINIPS